MGLKLAAVEGTPRPLLVVVMQPAGLPALRAGPALARTMLGEDLHALPLHVQVDSPDCPRRLQPQEHSVQLPILHHGIVGRPALTPPTSPSRSIRHPRSGPRSRSSLVYAHPKAGRALFRTERVANRAVGDRPRVILPNERARHPERVEHPPGQKRVE